MSVRKDPERGETIICDFCGKTQFEVRKMIIAPRKIGICNECIVLAVEVIVNEPEPKKITLEEGEKDDN